MTTVGRPVVLSEQVVRAVADSIDGGEFRPGSRLPTDRELCARFAVSRAVVREAVARLRADGYIETRQGAGAFVVARPGRLSFRLAGVVPSGREDLGHVMELRLAVEVAAAEFAAGRRT